MVQNKSLGDLSEASGGMFLVVEDSSRRVWSELEDVACAMHRVGG